jgi:hypothetical protein
MSGNQLLQPYSRWVNWRYALTRSHELVWNRTFEDKPENTSSSTQTTTTTSSSASQSASTSPVASGKGGNNSKSAPLGGIIGGAVGGVCVIVLIGGFIFLLRRKGGKGPSADMKYPGADSVSAPGSPPPPSMKSGSITQSTVTTALPYKPYVGFFLCLGFQGLWNHLN